MLLLVLVRSCLQLVGSDQVASVRAELTNKAQEDVTSRWEAEKTRVAEEKRAELDAVAAAAAEAAEAARAAAEVREGKGMGFSRMQGYSSPDLHSRLVFRLLCHVLMAGFKQLVQYDTCITYRWHE